MDDHERWQRRREAAMSMADRLRWLDEATELANAIRNGRKVPRAATEPEQPVDSQAMPPG